MYFFDKKKVQHICSKGGVHTKYGAANAQMWAHVVEPHPTTEMEPRKYTLYGPKPALFVALVCQERITSYQFGPSVLRRRRESRLSGSTPQVSVLFFFSSLLTRIELRGTKVQKRLSRAKRVAQILRCHSHRMHESGGAQFFWTAHVCTMHARRRR